MQKQVEKHAKKLANIFHISINELFFKTFRKN